MTLRELRTLRAKERLPDIRQHNTLYNGRFHVSTLDEVLALRARLARELRRPLGVYPETKHPTYFDAIGLSLEEPLLDALRRHGLDRAAAPVFVQSFETANLQDLRRQGLRAREVQLTSANGAPYDFIASGDPRTYADLTTRAGLRWVARYAKGLGPEKQQIIPRTPDAKLGQPTSLVRDAHAAGLAVHPYTFRAENYFLPVDYQVGSRPDDYGRAVAEQVRYLRTGIDGLFTDQPDIGVTARRQIELSGQLAAAA